MKNIDSAAWLSSPQGEAWLEEYATDLVLGRNIGYVSQDQLYEAITETLTDLEWNAQQDSAQVQMILMLANKDFESARKAMTQLIDVYAIAKQLLISVNAAGQWLKDCADDAVISKYEAYKLEDAA